MLWDFRGIFSAISCPLEGRSIQRKVRQKSKGNIFNYTKCIQTSPGIIIDCRYKKLGNCWLSSYSTVCSQPSSSTHLLLNVMLKVYSLLESQCEGDVDYVVLLMYKSLNLYQLLFGVIIMKKETNTNNHRDATHKHTLRPTYTACRWCSWVGVWMSTNHYTWKYPSPAHRRRSQTTPAAKKGRRWRGQGRQDRHPSSPILTVVARPVLAIFAGGGL